MIYALLLAGGSGTRMGSDKPKQFLMLKDKPVFTYAIKTCLENKKINKVIVLTPKDWIDHAKKEIKKYLKTEEVIVIAGGDTRQDTIMKGANFIEKEYGINDDDIVITHDIVRPFLTDKMLDDNIAAMKDYCAVDTVFKSTDTIVRSKDGDIIDSIPKRIEMYNGQTPQTFNLKKLITIFNSLTKEEENSLTDACKAFVLKGEKVKLVLGGDFNIKITTQKDLKLAELMLNEVIK